MSIAFLDGTGTAYPTAASTFNIPCPTSGGALAAGDLIIANVVWDTASDTPPARTLPTGWTTITSQLAVGTGSVAIHVEGMYHFVTSAEAASPPSSWAMTNGASYTGSVSVERHRGVSTSDPFAVAAPAAGFSSSTTTTTSATKVAPLVTVDTANAMLVTGAGVRSGSTSLTDVTPSYTVGGSVFGASSGRAGGVAHKAQAATGDSTTATWTTTTTNTGAAWQTALNPAAADTTAPTVPTGVTATANSSSQVTVAWTASTDAVGVASYRVRQGGVDVTGHTADASSPAVITGLSPSTSYSFTVSAVDAAGNRSAESTAATVTTPAAADTTAPTVPSAVTASAISSSQVVISWSASTDAVGVASYRVRRGGVDLTGATAVVGTTYTDSSVAASTSYSYTVSAIDAAGNRSAESSAASVTTPATTVVPPAPTPSPVPPSPRAARRLAVTVYQGAYVRVGQVPDYVSCSVTWNDLGVGAGELVVGEDDPVASTLLTADQVVVGVVVDLDGQRWSGRVSQPVLEREGPPGSGTITATLVDEWVWLQRMLASQNGANSSLATMPQYDTRTGPIVSVAADYINAAAARLGVPVVATKPASDSSSSVTLNARMTPLADLLTEPMRAAGVTMSAKVWLPGDAQPADIGTALTVPTIVFAPRVLADKPWLQWNDSQTRAVKLTFQGSQPVAYRAIVGLGGTDAARIYDSVTDTTRSSGMGLYALPEIYTDASDATLGTQSAAAGIAALIDAGGKVSVAFEVADGAPFYFGDDYVVGDMATIGVGGATWRQKITKLTVEDNRTDGLVITPVIGDSNLTGDDMMVQALARVAESVRTLQAGK